MIDANTSRRARLWLFVLLYAGFCISYIDRAAISISLVQIGKDFHLSTAALGVVMSAFYLSYAAMQIPGGWIHAQGVAVSGGLNPFGSANRRGIEQQLRKKCRATTNRSAAGETVKHCERRHVRRRRIGWEV